ncbi:MAG: Gfo/Idh/MocA family oxidoreductase, partial [Phycisphaerae bacterium]|nr:Gfo/Idh/MocA family oxidoreductase [Phycisphaerae bacterium]
MTEPATSRRRFLEGSAAAGAAAALNLAPFSTARAAGKDEIRIGLVGCGGRGGGAASQALSADPGVRLVALGDTFADQVENTHRNLKRNGDLGARVDVPPDRRFVGFDAYKKVIDSVDVVLLATSPYFRPMHLKYAVEKGVHAFVEKPVATDPAGLRDIMATCEVAKTKKLSIVSGLCYRYDNAKRETLARVHDGQIGEIKAMETFYQVGGLWNKGRKDGWSDMEWQIRNWLYFTWLSGDHITEQHIHSLDKIAWAMGDEYPVKATSSGGRTVRTDPIYGNIYDHFNTEYEWASGVRCFSSCRQWNGAASNVSDFVYGTKGVA